MVTTTAPEDAPARTRRRWPWIVLAVVLALVMVVGFVLLRDRDSSEIPNEVVLGQRGLATDMRDTRYCEVLLVEGRLISPTAAIYNTFGLNDCPAAEWDALNADAIKQEWDAISVDKNGPRYWTVDAVEGALGVQQASFGGIDMKLVAFVHIPPRSILSGGQAPYSPITVDRTNVWWFNAGKPVFELVDPQGQRYRMQAYSQIVDPELTYDQLPGLGDRLDLPDGWTYETRVLDRAEGVAPIGARATVIVDEMRNTYQLTDNIATGPATSGPPEGFVRLSTVAPGIVQEMRYAGEHNFLGRPVKGYDVGECWLTAPAARALARAQRTVEAQGYQFKVYDCYRPQRAVDDFVAWAQDPDDDVTRAEFYPRLEKDVLFPQGYILEKSGHTRGSTVDLTLIPAGAGVSPEWTAGGPLVDCAAPADERFADTSIDMGTGFDCFDPLSATASKQTTAEQAANREVLVDAMTEAGFTNLPEEWWHYTLDDEPYPDTYFDTPIS
ncbi:MAG: M15 family metallopeptidase [Actinobacteria bacterium]|nr:M15 family metallopeptidase [Actinomycetota bacterium]MCB0922254.1 M15 family metallopeptidase [Actinomycetota bacterium]